MNWQWSRYAHCSVMLLREQYGCIYAYGILRGPRWRFWLQEPVDGDCNVQAGVEFEKNRFYSSSCAYLLWELLWVRDRWWGDARL